jgi:hypothetical protein
MEYVPLHSLRVQLYYTFYSIALFVFSINRIRQNASRTVIAVYFNPIFEIRYSSKLRELTVNILILVYFGII